MTATGFTGEVKLRNNQKLLIRLSSFLGLSVAIKFQRKIESYKRVTLETIGCSIVDVKKGGWSQKRINSMLPLMLGRGISMVNDQD